MISVLYISNIFAWIITWMLDIVAYFFLLGKMGLDRRAAILPFLGERQFTRVLFRRMRTFYRPFVMAAVFLVAAIYLDPFEGMGRIFTIVAYVIYGVFLLRLYWNLAQSFGKRVPFRIGMVLVPPLFLLLLAFGRNNYRQRPLKPVVYKNKISRVLRQGGFVLLSVVEIAVLVCSVGLLTIREELPGFLVSDLQSQTYEQTKDITGTGKVVARETAMGIYAGELDTLPRSREYFYPDHSGDESVVVMTYVVGSNLENRAGLASANIKQMKEATRQGDGLTFVMEAGGSKRWFTDGIEDRSVGRYAVAGGELKKVKALPRNTCMSEAKSLEDFIRWTRKHYQADRYMLVLWDHGGGLPYGFGQDDLNRRRDEGSPVDTINISELVTAIKDAGLRFDVIGFDACLMQVIEVAAALEPYADYYLASEETEGGLGWFYTSAFGKLAKEPGMPSEAFARELIASYDPYNTILKDEDGKPDTKATLSFVDLTLAKPAYEKLETMFQDARSAIREEVSSFAAVAVAASNAYSFEGDQQIDLIDFLQILDKVDYRDEIWSHKDKMALITALRACVRYRNGNSAKGINGIAISFPYNAMMTYTDVSAQLKALSLKKQRKAMNDVFSIMAVQQEKENNVNRRSDSFRDRVNAILSLDYTEEDWYVKGFEEYDDSRALVDIPLEEVEEGYQIEMPKKIWRTIADCQTMVYQRVENGPRKATMRYLGSDHIGTEDAEGHPLINMDNTWVHIDGRLVCYEDQPARETKEGDVFFGTVKAMLNNEEKIILHIEWDPVTSEQDAPEAGHVIGYEPDDDWNLLQPKGLQKLKAGDSIQFVFDYYDDAGKLVKTKPAGSKIRVTRQSRLEVRDQELEDCDIVFGGLLKDIYQRVMTTEQIEAQIEH